MSEPYFACIIVNNHKEESSIDNFQDLQLLQVKIREMLFTNEPVSALKAMKAIKQGNQEWNRVNPPLLRIENPQSNKTIIGLIELLNKMDQLVPST